MHSVLLHPLGITLLATSVALTLAVRYVPGLDRWSDQAGWVLLWGLAGYAASVTTLYFTRPNAGEIFKSLEMAEARRQEEKTQQSLEFLEQGFAYMESADGQTVLGDLTNAYERIGPVLELRRESDPLSVSLLPHLTTESYRRGLGVLSDALELMRAAEGPDRQRLEGEVVRLESELMSEIAVGGTNEEDERRKIKEDLLDSHKQRLALLDRLQVRIDRLLFQAQRCESSLHQTRIELAAMRTGASESDVSSVVKALRETIRQAKEVQDELERLGL